MNPKTNYRLIATESTVAVDGSRSTFILTLSDPQTEQTIPEIRFFTDYFGLNSFLAKVMETISVAKTMLEKNGTFKRDSVDGEIHPLHIAQAGAGPINDESNVALVVRTTEGPEFSFSSSPALARELGERLISAAKATSAKSQQH